MSVGSLQAPAQLPEHLALLVKQFEASMQLLEFTFSETLSTEQEKINPAETKRIAEIFLARVNNFKTIADNTEKLISTEAPNALSPVRLYLGTLETYQNYTTELIERIQKAASGQIPAEDLKI